MDNEIDRLLVAVRADTSGFARDVAEMQRLLDGPFAAGLERAGRTLETSLARALRTGRFGFEDLGRIALSVLADIANAALRSGLDSLFGGSGGTSGGGGGGGGLGGLITLGANLLTSVLGLPGRATGGPVSPGRAFLVGERGPEVFVPTTSGSIATSGSGTSAREVRVNIAINGPADTAPALLARSARQVARQVRVALQQGD